MARFQKSRSTHAGRVQAFDTLSRALDEALKETREQIAERIAALRHHAVSPDNKTKEQLLVSLARYLAQKVVTS